MNTPSTARDYAVGTVLVIIAFALAFVIARFVMPADTSEVSPAVGATTPASLEGAGATAVLVSQQQQQDAWLSADPLTRRQQLMGQFDPAQDDAFVVLAKAYTDGDGQYLVRKQTATALQAMITAAKADGVTLQVRSATRNFDRQAQIWGAKWRGDRTLSNGINLGQQSNMSDSAKARMILLYSSMPGTSRHHWGTDVDFNNFNNEYFTTGQGLREYKWLKANAPTYGFFQPYTSKQGGRTGYEEEKWHWSFEPLSAPLLAAYVQTVSYEYLTGFDGSRMAPKVQAIEEYVRGVSEMTR